MCSEAETPLTRMIYAEGLVRGHKGVLLTTAQYNSLQQCETLDDIKLFLVRHMFAQTVHFPSLLGLLLFCIAARTEL